MNDENNVVAPLNSSAIRAWLHKNARPLDSPGVDEALAWARRQWFAYRGFVIGSEEAPCQIDHLHALLRIIDEDENAHPHEIESWYRAIEAARWGPDPFDEKLELLCQVGYLLWRQSRRLGDAAAAWSWEEKLVGLTLRRPTISEFLSLPAAQQTDQIRDRFLSDPSVFLTFCRKLLDLTYRVPREAVKKAADAYRYISGVRRFGGSEEESAYSLASLALVVAIGEKETGNYEASAMWLSRAVGKCRLVRGSEILRARASFVQRALAFQMRFYEESLEGVEDLKERFRSFGSERYVSRCALLQGMALKELGRDWEALPRFYEVASTEAAEVETWIKGLAMIHVAEIEGRNGRDVPAEAALGEAWAMIKDSAVAPTIAHFHGVKAEILRDRGCFRPAIQSYRLAVAAYASAGMLASEAYIRVVLAETLLGAGRDAEALAEVMAALPVVESLGLVQEGVAAVAILRESLARQGADPNALRIMKSELLKLRKRGDI